MSLQAAPLRTLEDIGQLERVPLARRLSRQLARILKVIDCARAVLRLAVADLDLVPLIDRDERIVAGVDTPDYATHYER